MQVIREPARPRKGVESARLGLTAEQTETVPPPSHFPPISTDLYKSASILTPGSGTSRSVNYSTVLPIKTVSFSHRARQISYRPTVNYNNLIEIRPTHTATDINKNCGSIARLAVGFINIRSVSTKALLINDLITEHNLDMMGLCETWLKPNESLPLIEASPPNFLSSQVAREMKKGGGVALIFNPILSLTPNTNNKFTSFEVLTLRHTAANLPSFYLAVLYRPPGPYSLSPIP